MMACGLKDRHQTNRVAFFDPGTPPRAIGSDDDTWKTGNYKSVWIYAVDSGGNIYITDTDGFKIDKFDKNGSYLLSFGGIHHASLLYPGWQDLYTADSKGNLAACSNGARKWLLFKNNGKDFQFRDFGFTEESYVITMKFDPHDNLFIMVHTPRDHTYTLYKADIEKNLFQAFHKDNQRIRPPFQDLPPDFDLDDDSHIYITDTIDYRIYKYDPGGRLIKEYFKDAEKIKIGEHDFNFLARQGCIQQIQGYENVLKKLTGKSSYFPAVIGINIDGNRVFAWTSHQDKEKKYRVDVYDLDFNYVCTTSYYNAMGNNRAVIKNGTMYIPNIESSDEELKKDVGRFGMFNIPFKLGIFRLSGKLTGRPVIPHGTGKVITIVGARRMGHRHAPYFQYKNCCVFFVEYFFFVQYGIIEFQIIQL